MRPGKCAVYLAGDVFIKYVDHCGEAAERACHAHRAIPR
jgi:hypothetical protein